MTYFKNYINISHASYVDKNLKEIEIGIICSELEGTLKIEGVNTTRRQIEKIINEESSDSKNSQIVLNMYNGLKFIYNTPKFTKENLKRLYDILSQGCLDKEDEIGDLYYRNDKVYIGDHEGCPFDIIDECMNSLFDFINSELENKESIIEKCIFHLLLITIFYIYIHILTITEEQQEWFNYGYFYY